MPRSTFREWALFGIGRLTSKGFLLLARFANSLRCNGTSATEGRPSAFARYFFDLSSQKLGGVSITALYRVPL